MGEVIQFREPAERVEVITRATPEGLPLYLLDLVTERGRYTFFECFDRATLDYQLKGWRDEGTRIIYSGGR